MSFCYCVGISMHGCETKYEYAWIWELAVDVCVIVQTVCVHMCMTLYSNSLELKWFHYELWPWSRCQTWNQWIWCFSCCFNLALEWPFSVLPLFLPAGTRVFTFSYCMLEIYIIFQQGVTINSFPWVSEDTLKFWTVWGAAVNVHRNIWIWSLLYFPLRDRSL